MPTFVPKERLLEMAGEENGPSSWVTVDQARIDRFAEATDDHQFIHVDPDRAASTPLGTTIAHGFLTLSLLPKLNEELAVLPENLAMAFNYGLNKVRFLQPVPVGSRVRLRTRILDVQERDPGRILVSARARVEIEGEERPAMIAETLTLLVLAEG